MTGEQKSPHSCKFRSSVPGPSGAFCLDFHLLCQDNSDSPLFQVKYKVLLDITQSSQLPDGIGVLIIITELIPEFREDEQLAYSHTASKGQR